MAKLHAEIDRLIKDFGEVQVMTMADTIRSYLTSAPAEPGNLEALSKKLQDLATKRDARHAANMANDNDELDAQLAEVDRRLRDAMRTMRLLPSGMIKPQSGAGGWPDVLREWSEYGSVAAEPPRLTPSSRDIAEMETMLQFVWRIDDPEIRKVLMLHASGGFSFRKLAKELHCNHETVRNRYRDGLTMLAQFIFKTV